jgi:antagonist of KipI
MSLRLLTDSILTTVQDTGRNGYRAYGINPNGVMDKKAVRLINILLGNNEDEAVLEMHFPAPKILFEQDAVIALGGANFAAQIDDERIQNWRPYFVRKGQILSFPRKEFGNRIYVSVRGGFVIDDWLESKSTNTKAKIGGFHGRRLLKNDEISFNAKCQTQDSNFGYSISADLIPRYVNSPKLRFIEGAEWEKLTGKSEESFLSDQFSISLNSDRMGFRLRSEPLDLIKKMELVSSAVDFGTIQLLPDGQLIILMADHQTTGGYPRIAHICAEDLPLVAQLGANDSLSFEMISIDEAENLTLSFEKNLNLLKSAVKFR